MKTNSASAHTVADFFLLQAEASAGDIISNLKLQKLCYYAQAWHLALFDKPLYSEPVQAWAHGPVVPDLYKRFKPYGFGAIDASILRTAPYDDLHRETLDFLADIREKYGSLTAWQLEDLTHNEDPWRMAYGDTPSGNSCTAVIEHASMRDYYRKQRIAA